VHGGFATEPGTLHGVPIVGGCVGHAVEAPPPAPLDELDVPVVLVVLAALLLLLEAWVVELAVVPPEPEVVPPVWLEVTVPPQRSSVSAEAATKKKFLKRCMHRFSNTTRAVPLGRLGCSSADAHGAVVVAVAAVRVVQVFADEVVVVIAVRHAQVAAARPVHVARVVAPARVRWRARARVGRVDGERVLVDVVAVHVVEVTVVEVVRVPLVFDGRVAAACTVLVRVTIVDRVIAHLAPSLGR
jgi:hypothetical protein